MSINSKDLEETISPEGESEGQSTTLPSIESVDSENSGCGDSDVGHIPLDNDTSDESDKHDVNLQTRSDTATNTQRPYSFDNMDGDSNKNDNKGNSRQSEETSELEHRSCIKVDLKKNDAAYWRNPITGDGLNGDGVGGLKPMTQKIREGNPLTGEGYKPGQQDYIGPINMKDAHESININRNKDGRTHVPPGGYSSGLW